MSQCLFISTHCLVTLRVFIGDSRNRGQWPRCWLVAPRSASSEEMGHIFKVLFLVVFQHLKLECSLQCAPSIR